MGWNEPDGKDPWGSGNRPNGGKRPNGGRDEPPELDEVIQNIQKKLSGIFGGGKKSGGGGGNQNRGSGEGPSPRTIIIVILIGLVVIAAINSVHIIKQGERGVVTRFGKYQTTLREGLAIRFPYPIEEVSVVNKETTRTVTYGTKGANYMLTADLNLIDVTLTVQYRIGQLLSASDKVKEKKDGELGEDLSVKNFKFEVANVKPLLEAATSSAIREVVGRYTLDFTLSENRAAAGPEVLAIIQKTMDEYESGLEIVNVTIEHVQVPTEVKKAFDGATAAREIRTKLRNDAISESKKILPGADKVRARELNRAKATSLRLEEEAKAQVVGYLALLEEYERAPVVTRERLYLEMVEEVYSNSPKVMLDVEQGNGMFYLPLQELMASTDKRRAEQEKADADADAGSTTYQTSTYENTTTSTGSRDRSDRSRDGRTR